MENKILSNLIRDLKLVVFDFDGVFTDNNVYVAEDGSEFVKCSRADGLGLRKLDEVGIEYLIISTETNPVVQHRAKKLNIKCYSGIDNKLSLLKDVISSMDLKLSNTAFVGNDINDLECLKAVGFPVIVKNSHPDLFEISKYITNASGGDGAVREICDYIYSLKNSI